MTGLHRRENRTSMRYQQAWVRHLYFAKVRHYYFVPTDKLLIIYLMSTRISQTKLKNPHTVDQPLANNARQQNHVENIRNQAFRSYDMALLPRYGGSKTMWKCSKLITSLLQHIFAFASPATLLRHIFAASTP
ncbi:hypothetical protein [Paraburkholderia sp. ZP32-5]|uniref:hypothetical protein n=1 Tax=Paraburkholderia sp. ZP32-5 TaxID=2883245 RepID=UPI001F40FA6C|nr:hypothetical protein [Paraburkholderia sp. ZP32-5]